MAGHQTHLQRPRQPFRSESKQGTGGYDPFRLAVPAERWNPNQFWLHILAMCALFSSTDAWYGEAQQKHISIGWTTSNTSFSSGSSHMYIQLIPHPHSLIRIFYNLLTSPPWLRGGCSMIYCSSTKFYPGGSTRHSFSKAFPCKHQPAIPA